MANTKDKKPGQPLLTDDELKDKHRELVDELAKLRAIPRRKRTAAQIRRFEYLQSYAARTERRIALGKWQ